MVVTRWIVGFFVFVLFSFFALCILLFYACSYMILEPQHMTDFGMDHEYTQYKMKVSPCMAYTCCRLSTRSLGLETFYFKKKYGHGIK